MKAMHILPLCADIAAEKCENDKTGEQISQRLASLIV
jgi:hypothetical protein